MNKVFYNPETLEIQGFSDGEASLELPHVETDMVPFPLENYRIVDDEGVKRLERISEEFTDEQWDKLTK